MPSRKGQAAPAWQLILEEVQSQNRATIEAVAATRVEIRQDVVAELAIAFAACLSWRLRSRGLPGRPRSETPTSSRQSGYCGATSRWRCGE